MSTFLLPAVLKIICYNLLQLLRTLLKKEVLCHAFSWKHFSIFLLKRKSLFLCVCAPPAAVLLVELSKIVPANTPTHTQQASRSRNGHAIVFDAPKVVLKILLLTMKKVSKKLKKNVCLKFVMWHKKGWRAITNAL